MIQVRRKSTESDLFLVQNALAADSDYRMEIAKLHKIRICVGWTPTLYNKKHIAPMCWHMTRAHSCR